MADRLGVETIDREGRLVVLKFRPQAKVDPARLVSLVRQRSDLTLVPPAAIRLTLDGESTPMASFASPARTAGRARGRYTNPAAAPSWWTARAKEGEVKPGFSKEEILRPAKEDPRASGGVFERVGRLLSDLLDA
jgi:hypothetical protein